jgi:hypothetical protein
MKGPYCWLLFGLLAGGMGAVGPALGVAPRPIPAQVQAFPGPGAILITYSSVLNATGYNVYRRPPGEAADRAVKVNNQPTPFTWLIDDNAGQGLPNGTPLLYFVKAVEKDAAGNVVEEAASKDVVVTPQVPILGNFFAHDIGTTDPSTVTVENNTLMIKAAGKELWDGIDSGTFVGTAVSGDYSISLKILEKPTGGHPASGKVGPMIRESLTPGSRYAFAMLTTGRGVLFEGDRGTLGRFPDRSYAWFYYYGADNDTVTSPLWLRLNTTSGLITAFE